MLIKLCKNNMFGTSMLFFILCIFLWSNKFIVYGFGNHWIYLQFALSVLEAILWAFIIKKHILSLNYLFVSILYMLAKAVFWDCPHQDYIALLNPFLLLLFFREVLSLYNSTKANLRLFNIGILLSALSLLTPVFVYAIPIIFFILFLYNISSKRLWCLSIVSISLPYLCIAVIDYLFSTQYLSEKLSQIPAPRLHFIFQLNNLVTYFLFLSIIFSWIAWVNLKNNPIRGETIERKRASMLSLSFVYFFVFIFFDPNPYTTIMPLIFPLSYLMTEYFTRRRESTTLEVSFMLYLCFAVLLKFIY